MSDSSSATTPLPGQNGSSAAPQEPEINSENGGPKAKTLIVDPNLPVVAGATSGSSTTTTPPAAPITPARPPCAFFVTNTCRHGDSCRFSHDPAHLTNPPPPNPRLSPIGGPGGAPGSGSPYAPGSDGKPPPILMIQTPPGHPIFSIDVECVATGVQHNARSIAQVALGEPTPEAPFSTGVFFVCVGAGF